MSEFRGKTDAEIFAEIEGGKTLTRIAEELGCGRTTLTDWIRADPARSARAREARIFAAAAWDEQAEADIVGAADPFELAKAKERAHHLRWRASKIAPRDYGDKVEVEHSGGVNVTSIKRTIIDPSSGT